MDLQAAKQWIVTGEQLGQCVEEQTLAETAGTGEEVVRAFLDSCKAMPVLST
ncbi:hypothetical protein D3C80_2078890 [compost metagenome]